MTSKPSNPPGQQRLSLLATAIHAQAPIFRKAVGFSLITSLLALSPTVFMLEVYDRVVNSRSVNTLLMISLIAFSAYALMEVLEKIRSQMLWGLGIQFELKLADRVYNAMFDGLLRKQMGNALLVQNDFRTQREIFNNPAL